MLVESFAKEQIKNNTGGPPDIQMLYSTEILKLCQERISLNEGHHHGDADVVRFVGRKV